MLTTPPSPRLRRLLALVGLLAVVGLLASACSGSSKSTKTVTVPAPTTGGASSSSVSSGSAAPKTTKPAVPTKPVHIESLEGDGSVWGVGIPIILYFDKAPTTSVDFTKNTTVTVNGAAANGAWYWEASGKPGFKVEAHYRPRTFWPGHARIEVKLPPAGTSAGTGLAFDGKLSSISMSTGVATIGTVDSSSHLTVTSDGKQIGVFPVALGAAKTPTYNGTKVIMYKGRKERMVGGAAGSAYDEIVDYSMRLTNSGEYLHSAPWNIANVNAGRPSSNGCSNLLPADAAKLFGIMRLGDPVIYNNVPDATKVMPSWDGYGDWNLSWSTWAGGGLLRNH